MNEEYLINSFYLDKKLLDRMNRIDRIFFAFPASGPTYSPEA
jgi:hypothetical protein